MNRKIEGSVDNKEDDFFSLNSEDQLKQSIEIARKAGLTEEDIKSLYPEESSISKKGFGGKPTL